jgi:hypothetical protein
MMLDEPGQEGHAVLVGDWRGLGGWPHGSLGLLADPGLGAIQIALGEQVHPAAHQWYMIKTEKLGPNVLFNLSTKQRPRS